MIRTYQRRFDPGFITGAWCQATLAYFPASYPLRALVVDGPKNQTGLARDEAITAASWDTALSELAEAVAGNPWLQRLPLGLREVVPLSRDGTWTARDNDGREVALRVAPEDAWQLVALGGGHPLTMFGEWNGTQWRPLSAWAPGSAKADWMEIISSS